MESISNLIFFLMNNTYSVITWLSLAPLVICGVYAVLGGPNVGTLIWRLALLAGTPMLSTFIGHLIAMWYLDRGRPRVPTVSVGNYGLIVIVFFGWAAGIIVGVLVDIYFLVKWLFY